MRIRRGSQTSQPDPAAAAVAAPFIVALYQALEDNLTLCADLIERHAGGASGEDLRDEALAGSRRIAYVCRMTWEMLGSGAVDPAAISQEVLPYLAFEAIARLEYALVSLAEANPLPEQLLSLAEIEQLIDTYRIGDWMRDMRARQAKATG